MKKTVCIIVFLFVAASAFTQVTDSLISAIKIGKPTLGGLPIFNFDENGIVIYGHKTTPKNFGWPEGTAFMIYHLDTTCKKLSEIEIDLGDPVVFIGAIRNGDDLVSVIKVGDFNRKKGYIITYNTISRTYKYRKFKVSTTLIEGDIAIAGNDLYIYEYPAFAAQLPPTVLYIDLSKTELELTPLPFPDNMFNRGNSSYGPRQILSIPGNDTVYFVSMYHPDLSKDHPYNLRVFGAYNGKFVYQINCGDVRQDQMYNYVTFAPTENGVYFYSFLDKSWTEDTLKVKRIYINNKQETSELILSWNDMLKSIENSSYKDHIVIELLSNSYLLQHDEIVTIHDEVDGKGQIKFIYTKWQRGIALKRISVSPFDKEKSSFLQYGYLAYCNIDTTSKSGSLIFDNGELFKCYSISSLDNIELKYQAQTGLHRSPNDGLSKLTNNHNFMVFEERFGCYSSSNMFFMVRLKQEKNNGPLILRVYKVKT